MFYNKLLTLGNVDMVMTGVKTNSDRRDAEIQRLLDIGQWEAAKIASTNNKVKHLNCFQGEESPS